MPTGMAYDTMHTPVAPTTEMIFSAAPGATIATPSALPSPSAVSATWRRRVKGGSSSPMSSMSSDWRSAYMVVVMPSARYSSMQP